MRTLETKTYSMSEQLCHCNHLSTGSARSYATPPIAKDEEIPILEDVALMANHAEDERAGIEDQEVPLPIPLPQTQVVDLGPAVSLQAHIHKILKRVNGQRCPFSLVCLQSGVLYNLRDPSKYL